MSKTIDELRTETDKLKKQIRDLEDEIKVLESEDVEDSDEYRKLLSKFEDLQADVYGIFGVYDLYSMPDYQKDAIRSAIESIAKPLYVR